MAMTEIQKALAQAIHHRDQLACIARDFVVLHGEEFGSCAADELISVVWDGTDYEEALERIKRLSNFEEL